jgi:hypothetical protein
MNQFVPSSFDEYIQKLALGLEPIDVQRGHRIAGRLDIARDGIPLAPPRPKRPLQFGGFELPDILERIPRHSSCVHALIERPTLRSPFNVRFMDSTRRYVPRRLSITLTPGTPVMLSPGFYPGAAYDVTDRATGIRGRVLRAGAPMRWARIEARVPSDVPVTGDVVGRAHGDDRGEFLLLLDVDAVLVGGVITGDLPPSLTIEVVAYGPLPNPPTPTTADLPSLDPLWDLPLEVVPALGPDQVTPGTALPPGYGFTATSHTAITFDFGRLKSVPPIVFA